MLSDIEASALASGIALSADILAVLVLLIILDVLLCGDGQIPILQFTGDVIFLESRKINVNLIALLGLLYIGLHNSCGPVAIQFLLRFLSISPELRPEEIIIKPAVKQIVIKKSRYHHHNSYPPSGCYL